jgi:DNA-binding response OmpR family regulator
VPGLAERIADEFKRGLVDALAAGSPNLRVPLGEGNDVLSAVWGAVARVRELVTVRSNGGIRFEQSGPEGGVPIVPWNFSERRAGERGVRSPSEASGVSLQGRRMVVADDDPAVVWFMSGLLKSVGVEVLEAHDGRRALEQTFDAWPDVVVSDVLMPKLDGFSLCHEIKRDVVVRDTPVILLSWKEDLLQRVRELGGSADGYLRKEAAASAVVERVREVLRARARVEDRIQSGGEVRGRLDGITPRLVLSLACREERDVRVTVRDAAFLFEARVRRGQLVSVTRSSQDGGFARGTGVLPSLLGATAGRFVVTPDNTGCRVDLHGALADLLKLPIERARESLKAVAASSLVRLARVELDRPLVEAYLVSSPEPAATLMRRLLAGERAKDLVLAGTPSSLLEAVLSDVARRGGVHAAELDPSSVPAAEPSDPPPPRWEPPVAVTSVAAAEELGDVTAPPRDGVDSQTRDFEFAKTLEDQSLRVSGPGAVLPLSQSVTPLLDTAAVGVTSATIPDARTLEGMGDLARVTARDPRPPESSSPELVSEELNEDVLGLFAEAEASSAPSVSPLGATMRSEPQVTDATSPPIVTPSPVAASADPPAAKTSTPPFAASAAKTMMSRAPDRPKSSREQATQPPASRTGRKTGGRKAAQQPPPPPASGWGVVIVKGLVAFAVAFGFTSWVLIPVLSPAPVPRDGELPAPNPTASASTAASASTPGADAER